MPYYGRLIRAQTLSERKNQYVKAERSLGASRARVLRRHILPNVLAPLLVVVAMDIPSAVIIEAGLAFLGLGVQPPTPDWGVILNDGFVNIGTSPWEILGPIVALVIMTTAFTVLGETMRDVLDPRQQLPRRGFLGRRSRTSMAEPLSAQEPAPVLGVSHLSVAYRTSRSRRLAVDDVSLALMPSQILGIVGESGCGKSTLGMTILRLLPPNGHITGGAITLEGHGDLGQLSNEQMRSIRGREIAVIFQDPATSLNPRLPIGTQLLQVQQAHAADDGRGHREEAPGQCHQQAGRSGPARPAPVVRALSP